MTFIEKTLRERTLNLFNDEWYSKTSEILLKQDTKEGYVYFIKNGEKSKNVKIGATYNLDSRIKSYKTAFDKGVFVIGYIKCDMPFLIEKEIHTEMKKDKMKGEFYKLNYEKIIMIKEVYDLKLKNNYISNKNIFKIEEKTLIEDLNPNIVELIKSLKLNNPYTIDEIREKYINIFNNEYPKTRSWMGRDITKGCLYLGLHKKSIVQEGTRYFVLI